MPADSERHQNEWNARIRGMLDEFVRLPSDDAALLAFADRVERLLAEFDPSSRAPDQLHMLAANVLLRLDGTAGEAALDRILLHIAAIRTDSEYVARELNGPIREMRARAFLKFARRDSAERAGDFIEALESALAACDPQADPAMAGVLAYNAAQQRLRHCGDAAGAAERGRIEGLFRQALRHYQAAGKDVEARDAAAALVQLAIEKLRRDALDDAERQRTFEEAWRLVNDGMAASPMTEKPAVWGTLNEIAAGLLAERPGGSRADNIAEALLYVDRALSTYRNIGDNARAAACAYRAVEQMDELQQPWSPQRVERYAFYWKAAADAIGTTAAAEGARQLALANAWAKTPDSTAIRFVRMRDAAEQALAMGMEAANESLCANALIMVGNSWLGESPPDGDAKGAETPPLCERLELARDAFERALAHARSTGETPVEAQIHRLLGQSLARCVFECDRPDLLGHCLATWERAFELSTGSERVASCLNVATVNVEGLRRGLIAATAAVRAAVVRAERIAQEAGAGGPLQEGARALKQALEEHMLLGPDLIESTRKLLDADGRLAPGVMSPHELHFRIYRGGPQTASGTDLPLVLTLVLFLQNRGDADGAARLRQEGSTVKGEFRLDCPACRTPNVFDLPLVVSLDEDVATAGQLEQMASGEWRCAACATPLQVQFTFVARARDFSASAVIVCPDIWAESMPPLAMQQMMLASVVHAAWTGVAVAESTCVPWSAVGDLPRLNAAALLGEKRSLALRLLAVGILRHDEEMAREGLTLDPELWKDAAPLEPGEWSRLLQPYMDSDRPLTPTELADVARVLNEALAIARASGQEGVLEQIRQVNTALRQENATYEQALSAAADLTKRREFLQRFLAEAPDYSPDRAQALYAILQWGGELELQAMEAKGAAADDPRYQNALSLMRGARAYARQRIEEDRKENSARGAKDLIRKSLAGEGRFVLLLRAFSVEVQISAASGAVADLVKDMQTPIVGWRTIRFQPGKDPMDRIVDLLRDRGDLLMIANIEDPMPPAGVAKLFVSDVEWRKLAFMLIAEAAAIVFVLPAERMTFSGAAEEIRAIGELGCQRETVVVVVPPREGDPFGQVLSGQGGAGELDIADLTAQLTASGFGCVLADDALAANPSRLSEAVSEILR
jgi:hypothetical protein